MSAAADLADKMSRALARANALAEEWAGDQTLVTRSAAADLFASVLELNGWEQQGPAPAPLRLVTPAAVEHCVHSRAIHHQHHKQPVTGCPWCTETKAAP